MYLIQMASLKTFYVALLGDDAEGQRFKFQPGLHFKTMAHAIRSQLKRYHVRNVHLQM